MFNFDVNSLIDPSLESSVFSVKNCPIFFVCRVYYYDVTKCLSLISPSGNSQQTSAPRQSQSTTTSSSTRTTTTSGNGTPTAGSSNTSSTNTASQSTPRPMPAMNPLIVGMWDPFLPCQSRHRTPNSGARVGPGGRQPPQQSQAGTSGIPGVT